MKKIGKDGFAMVEVLVLIMIFLIFLMSLFSMAGFRNKAAVLKVRQAEAKYAASAAVELMAEDVISGNSELEDGMRKRETRISFESDDGNDAVSVPVTIWVERDGDRLILYAEAERGGQKETAEIVLYKEVVMGASDESEIATDSNVQRIASASDAEKSVWVMESED